MFEIFFWPFWVNVKSEEQYQFTPVDSLPHDVVSHTGLTFLVSLQSTIFFLFFWLLNITFFFHLTILDSSYNL